MKVDLRKLSEIERGFLYLKAYSLYKDKMPQKVIAKKLGIRIPTICAWAKNFKILIHNNNNCIVKPEKLRGRGSRLSNIQALEIKTHLKNSNEFKNMDAKDIHKLILEKYQIDLAKRTIYDYIKIWNKDLYKYNSYMKNINVNSHVIKNISPISFLFMSEPIKKQLNINVGYEYKNNEISKICYQGKPLSQMELDIYLTILSDISIGVQLDILKYSKHKKSYMQTYNFSSFRSKPLIQHLTYNKIIYGLIKLEKGKIKLEKGTETFQFSLIEKLDIESEKFIVHLNNQNHLIDYFTILLLNLNYREILSSITEEWQHTIKWLFTFIILHKDDANTNYSISLKELHQLSRSGKNRLRYWKKEFVNKSLDELLKIGLLKFVYKPKRGLPYYHWGL